MPFVTVADVADVAPGKGALIERDGVSLAVFNAGGCAVSPVCPHEDGPLAEGFDLTTGAGPVDPALALTVYPVRVNGSAIEVEVP
ncbi:MAG: hypothetical protein HYU25_05350 [Candidatus Rokubacteria bacterium]|nr:hypothetical protein [Candidatus Rokubacteria bacterium]